MPADTSRAETPAAAPAFLPTEAESGDRFEAVMGFEMVERAAGRVRYRLRVADRHRNRQGVVHGGVIGALLDAAGMFAGAYDEATGGMRVALTVSTSCNYVGIARGEEVFADGVVTRRGRSMYFANTTVTDAEGNLVATGQGAYKYR